MTLDEQEQRWLHTAKALLDRSADELDQPTTLRLQRARVRAMTGRPRSARSGRWMFAGGLTTASAMILASVVWFSKPAAVIPLHEADDVEVVTAAEHLEFYDEIEFYQWLADHPSEG